MLCSRRVSPIVAFTQQQLSFPLLRRSGEAPLLLALPTDAGWLPPQLPGNMLRARGGGTLCFVLLFAALAAPAYGALTPVLGSAYVATQITFNSGANTVSDGSFTTATWRGMTGSTSASQTAVGVVWDVSNNSIAYFLDFNRIRVVNFANPASATAVTTLAVPGYSPFPASVYGSPATSSMCGDRLSPQTLYITRNYNGFQGSIIAVKLGNRTCPAATASARCMLVC